MLLTHPLTRKINSFVFYEPKFPLVQINAAARHLALSRFSWVWSPFFCHFILTTIPPALCFCKFPPAGTFFSHRKPPGLQPFFLPDHGFSLHFMISPCRVTQTRCPEDLPPLLNETLYPTINAPENLLPPFFFLPFFCPCSF